VTDRPRIAHHWGGQDSSVLGRFPSTARLNSTGASSNEGTITVNAGLTLSQTGTGPSFTNTGGITVASGQTVTISGGTFNQNAGSISGAGTLAVNSAIMNLSAGFSNTITALGLSSVTLNDPGMLTEPAGQSLTLTAAKINAPLVNQGTILVQTNTSTLTGSFNNAAGATLRLQGNSSYGNAALNAAAGLSNAGTIDLTSANSGYSEALTVTGGTLVNAAGAILSTSVGTGGNRTITAQFDNQAGATFLVNQGTTIDNSGASSNEGTITVNGGLTLNTSGTNTSFTISSGSVSVQSGTLSAGSLSFSGNSFLAGSSSGTLALRGNLTGGTTNADLFAPGCNVLFQGSGTTSAPELLEAMSQDLGNSPAGFTNNFDYNEISLENNTLVRLVNNAVNSGGTAAEALYVNTLIVPAGTTFDLNGLHVYARVSQINGKVINGTVNLLPSGGPLPTNATVPGTVATVGQVNSWTSYGRAGQAATVVVNPGGGTPAPLVPHLNYASVEVLDPSGNVLAASRNVTSGAVVTIADLSLPVDGTYDIQVQAPAGQAASVGQYLIAKYDSTVRVASASFGQPYTSTLVSPYGIDDWTFAAAAGQQIQLSSFNSTSPALQYNLSGPNGYTDPNALTANGGVVTLPASGSYTLSVTANGGQPGSYAFEIYLTTQTALTIGTPYQGTLTGSGEPQIFAINVPATQDLLVNLTDNTRGDVNALYAKFGSAPTRADYQYSAAVPASGSQQVLVPSAAAGTWYVLVYSVSVAAPTPFSITATSAGVFLTGSTPSHSGASADATLTLTGSGFDTATAVDLVASNGTTYPAATVVEDLPTQLTATFKAGSVPVGTYTVQVVRGANTADLPNAFTIDTGTLSNLIAYLEFPSGMGYHIASTLYLDVANYGSFAIPAPLIVASMYQVHVDKPGYFDFGGDYIPPVTHNVFGAFLSLDAAEENHAFWTSAVPAGFNHSVEVLASGSTPGYLQPGEHLRIPIYYAGWQEPWDFSYPSFNLVFEVATATPTRVGAEDISSDDTDWASQEAALQPPNIDAAAWNVLYANLTAQLGTTWGQFTARLDADAAYLGQLGKTVTDVSQLWAFELQRALGFSPVPTLASATDDTVDAPGFPITLARSYANSIIGRNEDGPFGLGWSLSGGWQRTLSVASDGTVTVMDADGSERVFQPDSRGSDYFDQTGDHGVLTRNAAGSFSLRELDGSATGFNANGTIAYEQDSNGNRITATYSGGLLTELSTAAGQWLKFVYNAAGRITSATDSAGRTATYTYDPTNQLLLSVSSHGGMVTDYTYNMGSNPATANALTSVQFPEMSHQYFTYDAEGHLASTSEDGGVDTLTFSSNAPGEISTTDASGATTQTFFDQNGQVAKTIDALGNPTFNFYDGNYNLVRTTDAADRSYLYAYDANGNVTSATDPLGNQTTFTYGGPDDELTRFVDANGNTTRYQYDATGNLVAITYANGTQQIASYNPLGEATDSVDPNGIVVNYTYNNAGQITSEVFSDGTQESFTYDAHDNLLTATNASGTTTYTYDDTDMLTEVVDPAERYLKFTYNMGGQLLSTVDQTGYTLNYAYNPTGNLSEVTDGTGAMIVTYT
jgi:YD repeat-containing protein